MIAERALAAAALAGALALARAEAGSSLGRAVRRGEAWAFRVEAGGTPYAGLYDPARRRLAVLHAPGRRGASPEQRLAALAAALPPESARLPIGAVPVPADGEPAAEAADALLRRLRSPRSWEEALLALEVRRLPASAVEPVRLPDEDAPAAALVAALLAPPAADPRPTVAEVLNGTPEAGLAARAAKMLRLWNVDVLSTGSAAAARERTLVYDRVGDFRRAAEVARLLGCPAARPVMRLDASRAVDVSVELGADCAGLAGRGSPPRRLMLF